MSASSVHFSTDERVFARAAEQFVIESARIARLLPDADIQHVGGTSVRGCRTKGDLDIQVRVPPDQLVAAAATLASAYVADDENPPAHGRVSFRSAGNPPVGVQLTAIGSPEDKFWRLRDVLVARSDLCSELDQLKAEHEGAPMAEYRPAKAAFFDALQATPEYHAAGRTKRDDSAER
jgi:GrpB-like predicted nucleotidyltransferase (UPF0157 family)